MDIKEQILTALGIEKKINLEWQAKSEDGTIFVSTAEELEAGVDISVLTEDGTTILLPVGTYKTDTGVSFRVEEEGIVAEVIESETEEEVVEEEVENKDEKKEYADVEDWEGMEKRIQNLEDAVASLKGEDMEEEEEKEEELSAPNKTPRKTKTTIVDEFAEMKKENEELKIKLSKLPADRPLNTNKFSKETVKPTKQQLSKMSKQEKYLYNLYN
tara:strand:+ start:1735 stop:2379 length:645 start_codon:yes stop_codon:yes gene_type:complete